MKIILWFRRLLLTLFQPVAKRIGHVYVAFRRPKMTLEDVRQIQKMIQLGDVLLCRSGGEFTNYLIPGFWTHAAMFAGRNEIVEAVSPCVRIKALDEWLLEKDYVAVLRPLFATSIESHHAVLWARMQARSKMPYDYQFVPTNEAFYCSELIGEAYIESKVGQSPFKPRYSLGILTYIPSDFYFAIDKFSLVWVSLDEKVPDRLKAK